MSGERPIVSVSHLTKIYRITTRSQQTLFKRLASALSPSQDTRSLLALNDVSFQIGRGEFVGIIGPNGAGKSTLLMILSGIIRGSSGGVEVNARMGKPFLSLGAALHTELNVEDNIRLCGALLGFTRAQTNERMDSIIDFGELAPYRYAKLMELSSGFVGRVIFSVALHSESELMLLDENLSVGDLHFREKARRAFKKLVEQGRTVVMVDHNMAEIKAWCSRALYLSEGRIVADGGVDEVVGRFTRDSLSGQWPEVAVPAPQAAASAGSASNVPERESLPEPEAVPEGPGWLGRAAGLAAIAREFLHFLWQEKLWWLIPMFLVLLLLGLLLLFGQQTAVVPFIYTMF